MCSERCSSVIDYALSSVPFYSKWRVKDPGRASSEKERFAALPILTKRDLRAHLPLGFMDARHAAANGFASGDIEMVSTSGTAEEQVSVVWNQVWWDRSEREASRLHPVLDRIFAGSRTTQGPKSRESRCAVSREL